MATSSRFRIYYSRDPEPLTQQLETAALAEAVRLAEARCACSPSLRYFEIWQDANLLFASGDHPNCGGVASGPHLRVLADTN